LAKTDAGAVRHVEQITLAAVSWARMSKRMRLDPLPGSAV
jgi:hypothetical protein